MSQIIPYLLFDGNCAEAMTFYKECLGAELALTKAKDSPMSAQFPPALQERIINAELNAGDLHLTGSDWFIPTEKAIQGNTVCIYIRDARYADLTRYFNALREGASLINELQDMPFGSYGALTDKFGVRWMFQGEGSK